jgi:hypothetical protein
MALKPGDFGINLYPEPKRLPKPCSNCPFTREAIGQGFITKERLEDIKFATTLGQPFHCHKTVYSQKSEFIEREDGDGTMIETLLWGTHLRTCEGALRWAERFNLEKEAGKDYKTADAIAMRSLVEEPDSGA